MMMSPVVGGAGGTVPDKNLRALPTKLRRRRAGNFYLWYQKAMSVLAGGSKTGVAFAVAAQRHGKKTPLRYDGRLDLA
jgi:hypothetical protein